MNQKTDAKQRWLKKKTRAAGQFSWLECVATNMKVASLIPAWATLSCAPFKKKKWAGEGQLAVKCCCENYRKQTFSTWHILCTQQVINYHHILTFTKSVAQIIIYP